MMSLPDTAFQEEIRRLEQQRTRDPRGHTFARLADLYRKSGLPEKGLEVVELGLAHHPHYLNAHLVHARILSDLGRGPEATAAFRRVLDIDEENLVALQALEGMEADPASRLPSTRPTSDVRAESTSWLAQLEAEWREKRDPALNGEGGERSVPDADASTSPSAVTEAEEVTLDPAKPDRAQEVATATLAELYLRQDLYEEAISVYEKLLARDPYNARLAANLDEARRLSQHGPRRAGRPAPPAPAPAREIPHPQPTPPPMPADEPETLTSREHLTAILEGRARLSPNTEPGALDRLRRWLSDVTTAAGE